MNNSELKKLCKKIRRDILEISYNAHIGHVGSALSIVEILSVLYFNILKIRPNNPKWASRDRFILSKGHASAALYSTLYRRGYFSRKVLEEYCQDGGLPTVHPEFNGLRGIDHPSGSLGHGLSVSSGLAFGIKKLGSSQRVFCLLSDGELNEGEVWEAAMFSSQHKLDNLTAIVDLNGKQGLGDTREIISMDPLDKKWQSFGWEVISIDGHDLSQITQALKQPSDKPRVIIARTIIGKGVSFMEGNFKWHYYDPKLEHLNIALKELKNDYTKKGKPL